MKIWLIHSIAVILTPSQANGDILNTFGDSLSATIQDTFNKIIPAVNYQTQEMQVLQ